MIKLRLFSSWCSVFTSTNRQLRLRNRFICHPVLLIFLCLDVLTPSDSDSVSGIKTAPVPLRRRSNPNLSRTRYKMLTHSYHNFELWPTYRSSQGFHSVSLHREENTSVGPNDMPTFVLARGFGSLVSGVSGRRRIRFLDGKRKSGGIGRPRDRETSEYAGGIYSST